MKNKITKFIFTILFNVTLSGFGQTDVKVPEGWFNQIPSSDEFVMQNLEIVLGKDGVIEGDVVCADADVSGTIKAKISVTQLLSLKSTAKLNGDIITNKLSIEPGASFTGSCSMGAVIKDIKHAEKQEKKEKTA